MMKTSAKRKPRLLLGCFEAKSETVLRYTSRLTSLIITSSFCNSGSVYNNKITKKEFILGLKSPPSERIYESFYDQLYNSIPTLRRFHYHGATFVNNQIDHKMLRWPHSVERRKPFFCFYLFKLIIKQIIILLILFALMYPSSC